MNIDNKIKQLSEENQKVFKRACVAHVISRVEKTVNENPSDEALECVRLVRLWLSDEGSVSADELDSAADAAANAANAANADTARSAAYAAQSAAYAAADAAAVYAAWSAADATAYAAATAADATAADAYYEAKEKEERWQERLVDKLLRKQEIESSSDEGDLLTLARDFIEQNRGESPREVLGAFRSKIRDVNTDSDEKQMAIDYLRRHLYENVIKKVIKTVIKEQIKRSKT